MPEDAPSIVRLHIASATAAHGAFLPHVLPTTATPDRLERRWVRRLADDAPRTCTLVAEQDDGVVGYCFVGPVAEDEGDPSRVAELRLLYVDPLRWRQGIGRALLAAAVDEFRHCGYEESTLWSIEQDAPASAFYLSTGWMPDGARARIDEGPYAIRYRRTL